MAESPDKAAHNPSFTYVRLAIYDNNSIVVSRIVLGGIVLSEFAKQELSLLATAPGAGRVIILRVL